MRLIAGSLWLMRVDGSLLGQVDGRDVNDQVQRELMTLDEVVLIRVEKVFAKKLTVIEVECPKGETKVKG